MALATSHSVPRCSAAAIGQDTTGLVALEDALNCEWRITMVYVKASYAHELVVFWMGWVGESCGVIACWLISAIVPRFLFLLLLLLLLQNCVAVDQDH